MILGNVLGSVRFSNYLPEEEVSNDSVIYTKEPTPISVGVKPVKFCEEDTE